jgi:hypothetical protein
MRYLPGSIALSESRDYPLLRIVLHSRFITHKQLYELMRFEAFEPSTRSFNNRISRLVKHGFLRSQRTAFAGRVYSITATGLAPLIRRGECYTLSINEKDVDGNGGAVAHCLEINEVQLSLRRSGLLLRWVPETMVRSRNSKDYDALVSVRLNHDVFDFGLEYERTPKAAQYYTWIRKRIEADQQVGCILYICSNFDLLAYVAGRLRDCRKPIYFGLFWEFVKDPKSARLVSQTSLIPCSIEGLVTKAKIV